MRPDLEDSEGDYDPYGEDDDEDDDDLPAKLQDEMEATSQQRPQSQPE